ncbi:hypothetical protein D3C74_397710 [compost metagenome]
MQGIQRLVIMTVLKSQVQVSMRLQYSLHLGWPSLGVIATKRKYRSVLRMAAWSEDFTRVGVIASSIWRPVSSSMKKTTRLLPASRR